MRKFLLSLLAFATMFQLALFAAPLPAAAQGVGGSILNGANTNLKSTGLGSDTATESGHLLVIVGNIVRALLALVGIIFVLLIIYAGFLWLTAGGDPKKVDQAKAIIRNCIIGLVIMVLAYSITSYVFNALQLATQ